MNEGKTGMLSVVITGFRILFFRASREELLRLDGRHLSYGLLWTWLVGFGRHWDHDGYALWQYLGLASFLVVFALSLVLAAFIFPLRPKGISFMGLLTFVSLTSPPAVLYAIPVERYFDLESANGINLTFLLIIAIWRVALVHYFVVRAGRFRYSQAFSSIFLPITVAIAVLTFLNLDGVMVDFMSGVEERTRTSMDASYIVLMLLGGFSYLGVIPILILWIFMAIDSYWKSSNRSLETSVDPTEKPERSDHSGT